MMLYIAGYLSRFVACRVWSSLSGLSSTRSLPDFPTLKLVHKIMEHILMRISVGKWSNDRMRLIQHYEKIFSDSQFGFRANHRTTDSIFILKSLISKYLKKNKGKILCRLCRLTQSFRFPMHNGLIYKLMINGIGVKKNKHL